MLRLSFIYILKLAIPAEATFRGWADESLLMLERERSGGFSHEGGCCVPHMSPDGLLSLGITVHDEILKVNVADGIRRFSPFLLSVKVCH